MRRRIHTGTHLCAVAQAVRAARDLCAMADATSQLQPMGVDANQTALHDEWRAVFARGGVNKEIANNVVVALAFLNINSVREFTIASLFSLYIYVYELALVLIFLLSLIISRPMLWSHLQHRRFGGLIVRLRPRVTRCSCTTCCST